MLANVTDDDQPFTPGSTITRREVLHGRVWLEQPVKVIADDGDVLVVLIEHGDPMHFVEHPFGPHPWSGATVWRGPSVLQLHRVGDWYSVWKLMDGAELLGWHINFDEPFVRRGHSFDVNDLQLDLLSAPDGTSRWKDVEVLAPALTSGRMDRAQLDAVLEAATDVAAAVERGDRWWSSWDGWTPAATSPLQQPGTRSAR